MDKWHLLWRRNMKYLYLIGAVALGLSGSLSASAMDVEVKLSPRIEKNLKSIDRIELRRESFFREYRVEGANRRPVGNLNVNRFSETEFANERLIPEIDDFSFVNLAAAMAEHSLSKVEEHNPGHKLVVEIDKFWVTNYSLTKFASFNTRMVGTVSLVDAAGKTVASEEVDTPIVPQFTQSWNYQGSEYAYLIDSANVRVAPLMATFLEKGIERLYPDADVPGPIFVRR